MATREINLIAERKRISPGEQKIRHFLKVSVPVILGIYAVFLGALFSLSVYQSRRLANLDDVITTEKSQIQKLERNEGMYMLLKQKSVALTKILDQRYPYVQLYEFIRSLESQNAQIKSVGLREDGQTMVDISVPDSLSMENVIGQLLDAASQKFSQIDLVSVNFNADGSYTMSLTLLST